MDRRNRPSRERIRKNTVLKTRGKSTPVGTLRRWYTFAPALYFVVISGSTYWGIVEVLPILYSGYDPICLRFSQVLAAFISLEIMVNWFCIRYVGSEYAACHRGHDLVAKHGLGTLEKLKDVKNENGSIFRIIKDAESERIRQGQESMVEHGSGSSTRDAKDKARKLSDGVAKRTKVFKMVVETSLPDGDGNVEQSAYDYWSWKPCVVCRRPRPPRCHHCVLCRKCVLKRDHHCFFTGSCVGINNQRHFTVFLFWAFVGCLYASLHMAPYAYYEVLPHVAYVDFVLPATIIRAVLGYQTFGACGLVFLGWALAGLEVFSAFYLVESLNIILASQTTFELANDMEITDTRSNRGRIRGVFGYYWLLNFLIPCHWVFEPIEDPLLWPTIKM